MIVSLLHILPPGQALWPLWAWRAPPLFPWTKADALGRARQLLPLLPFDQNLDSAPSRQESQFPPSQQQLCWEAAKTFKIKSVSPSSESENTLKPIGRQWPWSCSLPTAEVLAADGQEGLSQRRRFALTMHGRPADSKQAASRCFKRPRCVVVMQDRLGASARQVFPPL